MAKIREDKYSVYIKINGSYYRPIFPVGYVHLERYLLAGESRYKDGETIAARKKGGSPLSTVGEETWHEFGSYSNQSSEEAYVATFKLYHFEKQ